LYSLPCSNSVAVGSTALHNAQAGAGGGTLRTGGHVRVTPPEDFRSEPFFSSIGCSVQHGVGGLLTQAAALPSRFELVQLQAATGFGHGSSAPSDHRTEL
jgi:hypothetical protein